MAQRGNYSSKLRQEREGADNTLRTEKSKSLQNINTGNSERTGRNTGTYKNESSGIDRAAGTSKKHQEIRKPGNFAVDSTVDTLNRAVRDSNEDENIGVEALVDTEEGTVNTLRFGQEVNYRHKLHQKQKDERATGDGQPSRKAAAVEESSIPGQKSSTRAKAAELKQPGNRAAERISSSVHQSMRNANEDENVGIEAAVDLEEGAENTLRLGRKVSYRRKLRQEKKSTQDFRKATGASASSSRQTAANRAGTGRRTAGSPDAKGNAAGRSNPLSRWRQRQNLKQLYVARQSGTIFTASSSGARQQAGEKLREVKQKLSGFVREHTHVIIAIVIGLLVISLLASMVSSCTAMSSSTGNVLLGTSYTAEDEDILAVEADYCALEEELNEQIENIESDYPDYDEYNYDLAQVGHDPYQLAALLTVLLEDYTEAEALEILDAIFELQYTLELEEVVEIRTRTVYVEVTDPETGETYTESYEEEYEYYILNVTLTNTGITAAAYAYGLTDDQLERYEILLETLGNREYLFSDVTYATSSGSSSSSSSYLDYSVSAEALTDTEFANMIAEAEKYLGMAYVWGGSSPSTGFDCSGFVCWVINNCGNGWYVGRTTANGLLSYCTVVSEDDLQPGDLVFFQGTYNTTGASHVGIYVGNGMMIHCGNPISYTSIETTYWQSHLLCYGRIS